MHVWGNLGSRLTEGLQPGRVIAHRDACVTAPSAAGLVLYATAPGQIVQLCVQIGVDAELTAGVHIVQSGDIAAKTIQRKSAGQRLGAVHQIQQ